MDKFEKGLAAFAALMIIFVLFVDLLTAHKASTMNKNYNNTSMPEDSSASILGPSDAILEAFYEVPGDIDLVRLVPNPFEVFTDEDFNYSCQFDEEATYGFICTGVAVDMFRRYRLTCERWGFRAGEVVDDGEVYSAESLSGQHVLKIRWVDNIGNQAMSSMIVRIERSK